MFGLMTLYDLIRFIYHDENPLVPNGPKIQFEMNVLRVLSTKNR